jgi:hypothetical protein
MPKAKSVTIYVTLIVVPVLIGGLLSLMCIQEPKGAIFLVLGVFAGIILFVSLGCLDLVSWLVSVITKRRPSSGDEQHEWNQFRLPTVLVFIALCSFACSWLIAKKNQARRERELAIAIQESSGYVEWCEDFWWRTPLAPNGFFGFWC